MDAAARLILPSDTPTIVFEDGLGQRTRHPDAGGTAVERLHLRPSFATVPSFEFALRERTGRLAGFKHPAFVRVRGVERSGDADPLLTVTSDAAPGVRLSTLLAGAEARRVPLDIYAALCLIRQMVSALAMLHDGVRDVAHGTLGTERLFVTPQSRLLVAEPVLGAAIEQLRLPRDRYWRELGVAVAPGTTRPLLDARTDAMQMGLVALALILGRPLRDAEVLAGLGDLVSSVWAVSPRGGFEPLPHGLRGWLSRSLQLDPQRSFASPTEARTELDALLGDAELVSSPARLDEFLTRYRAGDGRTPALVRRTAHREPTGPTLVEATPAAAPGPTLQPAEVSVPAASATSGVSGVAADDTPLRTWWWRVAGVAALLAMLAGAALLLRWPENGNDAAATGTLELSTRPATVKAIIDGTPRGATPLVVALEAGPHTVELRGTGRPRRIQLTITPGLKVSQFVDLTTGTKGRSRGPAAPRQR